MVESGGLAAEQPGHCKTDKTECTKLGGQARQTHTQNKTECASCGMTIKSSSCKQATTHASHRMTSLGSRCGEANSAFLLPTATGTLRVKCIGSLRGRSCHTEVPGRMLASDRQQQLGFPSSFQTRMHIPNCLV